MMLMMKKGIEMLEKADGYNFKSMEGEGHWVFLYLFRNDENRSSLPEAEPTAHVGALERLPA
jgi:hypothetical protein